MSARILPFVAGSVFTAAVALLGIGVSQAQPRPVVVQAMVAPPTVGPAATVVAPPPSTPSPMPSPMFQGEQTIDTSGGSTLASAAPLPKAGTRVRTPSDENLPRWVPTRGRLTVVDSSDLAENLGLVPRGTSKKTGERISAVDKLEEEAQARAALARASAPASPPQGFAFSVKSHIRNHR